MNKTPKPSDIPVQNETIGKLQSDTERYKVALERTISGEAFFVGGMVPQEFLSEWKCRCKFIKLILEGATIKVAMKQAVDEQQKIMDDWLVEQKSEAYRRGQVERVKELRKQANNIEQGMR